MQQTSSWIPEQKDLKYPALKKDLSVEIAIIGGGLAGVLSAYMLTRAGHKVAVFERDQIGSGVTAMTTAFITQEIDTEFIPLKKMFGPQKARLVWESGAAAIDLLEEIVTREKIDCDFKRCPAHIYARTEREFSDLKKEAKALQRAGFEVELRAAGDLPFPQAGSLLIPNQAKFHPLKFLQALTQQAVKAGVQIYEHTEIEAFSNSGAVRLRTKNGKEIATQEVIMATYQPFQNPKATLFKKGMYRSYVLEVEFPDPSFSAGLYWDLANPYNYFRIDRTNGEDRIILGGADHRDELPMNPEKNFNALKARLEEIAPGRKYRITRQWHGPILEPSDGLALIGEYAPHRYVVTAFSGNGMTYSAISALLLTDLIGGKRNAWKAVYDPKRPLKPYPLYQKGLDYIQEFFGGAVRNMFRRRK